MPDTAHDLETAPAESRSSGDGNAPALVSFTEEAGSPETARQLDIAAESPAVETVAAQDDDIAPEDETAEPPESGLNEYRDDASSLLTGIDRLGFLGPASFLKEAYPLVPVITDAASAMPPAGNPTTGSPVPISPREDDEPLPPGASGINSRFVMFLDKSLLSPDDTLYFSMAGYAQNEQDPLLAGSALSTVEGYGTVSVNADGGIVYTLKSEAEAAVKNGETLLDHIRYTDVNGAVRTIQVVITADPVYNSRAFPGWSPDLYETHWGNIFLVDYNVTATGNDDVLTFEGLQGCTIIAGAGHDAVTVLRDTTHTTIALGDDNSAPATGNPRETNSATLAGAMTNSVIFGDAGDDSVTVSGLVSGSRIETGGGDDLVRLESGVAGGSAILTGEGNDRVLISGPVEGHTHIDLGSGDDSITVTGAVDLGSIRGGTGADTITITGNVTNQSGIFTGQGMKGSDPDDSDGADNVLTILGFVDDSALYGDAGADTFHIAGMVTNTRIDTGLGNDTIVILGGLGPHADVNGGGGNDVIYVAGSLVAGYPDNAAYINGGDGDDVIFLDCPANHLQIYGGDGTDTLVLRADSFADFVSRYSVFLAEYAFYDVENIQFDVAGSSDPDILDWLDQEGIHASWIHYGGTPPVPPQAAVAASLPNLDTAASSLEDEVAALMALYSQTGGV